MTLPPRSLFGRLVLVLLAGLLTAQLLSFAIHMRERGKLLMEANGMQSAQRIADIVKLLESLGPAERRRIASILSTPPMTLKVDQAPLVAVEQSTNNKARGAVWRVPAPLSGRCLATRSGDYRQQAIRTGNDAQSQWRSLEKRSGDAPPSGHAIYFAARAGFRGASAAA